MNPSVDSANASYGLPKMSDIYSNINAPTLNDLGGSVGDKAVGLNAGPTSAFKDYSAYSKTLPNTFDAYQGLLDKNGIPQLQKTSENLQGNINSLQDQIYRTTPMVSANTSNSLVTDSQRQGMIDTQTLPLRQLMEPLSSNLGQVNSSLATQEQNVGHQIDAMSTQNQQNLDVGKLGVTVAEDNAARALTGYTTDADNILQGLLKKMDITGQLDAAEWATLSNLAEKKQEYGAQLDQIKLKNQYQTVGPGGTLINTKNGAYQTY